MKICAVIFFMFFLFTKAEASFFPTAALRSSSWKMREVMARITSENSTITHPKNSFSTESAAAFWGMMTSFFVVKYLCDDQVKK